MILLDRQPWQPPKTKQKTVPWLPSSRSERRDLQRRRQATPPNLQYTYQVHHHHHHQHQQHTHSPSANLRRCTQRLPRSLNCFADTCTAEGGKRGGGGKGRNVSHTCRHIEQWSLLSSAALCLWNRLAHTDSRGVVVCEIVPVAAISSAGVVGWRIDTGNIQGPLPYNITHG